MATSNYMPRGGRDNDPSVLKKLTPNKVQAPGHPAELQPRLGAANRTPSPTRAPYTTADQARSTSWGRSDGRPGDNPGKNGFAGSSSLNPGEKAGPATISPLGPAGPDPVLQNLLMGTARAVDGNDNWQTRDLNDPADNPKGRPPINPGTPGASPGPKMAAKTGQNRDDADQRYAAARGNK